MRATALIELHSAPSNDAHMAFLVDRGGGAWPEPRPWYRTAAHPTRVAALAELRRFVDRMAPLRAWADDVRAQTAGQVPKRLPLRPSVPEMREGERWRLLMEQVGEGRGGSGAERW
ncbi:hypothetical protein GTA08_BOTSDO08424 [Neofusicoccum parvum]|nr:hypothetical protein GTA08_BOTSDO08424 [Neofusicoccum parvum]